MDAGSSSNGPGSSLAADPLSSSVRRNQFRGGYTPEVLHEPFRATQANSHTSTNNSYFSTAGVSSQLDEVPLTSSAQNGSNSINESSSLSSSVRKHAANKRSIGSVHQLNAFMPVDDLSAASSRASSVQSSPKLDRDTGSSTIGMGPAPGRGFYKHKVIPSLTSGVPPVLAGARPKGWPSTTPTTANATGSSTTASRAKWDTPQAWIVYYFVANLSLTLYNKLLMNRFPFAWSLTAIHALSGCIGAQICLSRGFFVQQRLTTRENLILISFSSLYTVNIAVSNLSLNLVTVPVSNPR